MDLDESKLNILTENKPDQYSQNNCNYNYNHRREFKTDQEQNYLKLPHQNTPLYSYTIYPPYSDFLETSKIDWMYISLTQQAKDVNLTLR